MQPAKAGWYTNTPPELPFFQSPAEQQQQLHPSTQRLPSRHQLVLSCCELHAQTHMGTHTYTLSELSSPGSL